MEIKNTMENKQQIISKKAIILIYPDGKVESIDENLNDNRINHNGYYALLCKKSERLQQMLASYENYLNNKDNFGHLRVDRELVYINGVTVFLNLCIGLPQNNRDNGLSPFWVFTPNEYGSLKQLDRLEKLLKWYPDDHLSCGIYREKLGRFKSTSLDDVLKNIEESKIKMKEGINYGKL